MVDFPNNPVNGDKHTEEGQTWQWVSPPDVWQVLASPDETYLKLTGGTMTGVLNIARNNGQIMNLVRTNAPDGNVAGFRIQATNSNFVSLQGLDNTGTVMGKLGDLYEERDDAPTDTTLLTRRMADARYGSQASRTWRNVTRVKGTIYTNDTGSDIEVYIEGSTQGGINSFQVNHGAGWITVGKIGGSQGLAGTVTIPDGAQYRSNGNNVHTAWAELRND